jgi:hypothetical protein
MKELTKLEAGKTYVFKDELACILWSDIDENDYIRSEFYDDGFAIDEVYDGDGYIWDNCIIIADELKYFKLKEEETMHQPKHIRPEDEVTITTTYGELAVALYFLGEVAQPYGQQLYNQLLEVFNLEYADFTSLVDDELNFYRVKSEVYATLFPEPTPVESPTQRKVRDLREQAELLLAKARELEESV